MREVRKKMTMVMKEKDEMMMKTTLKEKKQIWRTVIAGEIGE